MDYDIIYEKFLDLCGYDNSELPRLDVMKYRLIHNGVDMYNQKVKKHGGRFQQKVEYDDDTETINTKLTPTELKILAYSMCVTIASTKYTEFTSLWGVTANETGLKDYKAQVSAREYTIDYFKSEVNALVEDEIDTFGL